MEGRKESKSNLAGICPKCGDTIKVELTIATELIETNEGKGTEEKDNAKGRNSSSKVAGQTEGAGIRHDSKSGNITATSGNAEPADSEKTTGTKKAGGKTK